MPGFGIVFEEFGVFGIYHRWSWNGIFNTDEIYREVYNVADLNSRELVTIGQIPIGEVYLTIEYRTYLSGDIFERYGSSEVFSVSLKPTIELISTIGGFAFDPGR